MGCTENNPARSGNQGLCFPVHKGSLDKGQLQGWKNSLSVTITKKLNLEDTAYPNMTWKSGGILIQNKKVNYHFFFFVSDSRAWIAAAVYQRQGHICISEENYCTGISAWIRNHANVWDITIRSMNCTPAAVCWICSWYLDQWEHLAAIILEYLQDGSPDKQWYWGLASCFKSSSSRKVAVPFYLLIELLYREAKLSALQIRLVSEKKLKRIQGKNYRSLQSKIFDHGENYLKNRTSAQQLLMTCRHLMD